jgi:hypothetical protein
MPIVERHPFFLSSHTRRMLELHPEVVPLDIDAVVACIRSCLDCAQACTSCADACLFEDDVRALVRCIRLNQDCADLCEATAKALSRETALERELATAVLHGCETACRICAEECERHDEHEHCKVCAEACRTCEQTCRRVRELAVQ